MPVKYVFVTGGVVSGLGKGITAASLGRLLKARGYKVTMQKFDPYINIDPGTMNPVQHGEVFVTDDGAEHVAAVNQSLVESLYATFPTQDPTYRTILEAAVAAAAHIEPPLHAGRAQRFPATRSLVSIELIRAETERTLRDATGASLNECRIVQRLGETDHPERVGTLAEQLMMSPVNAARAVDRLVGRGWAKRLKSPHDKKAVYVALTDEGVYQGFLISATVNELAATKLWVRLTPEQRDAIERVGHVVVADLNAQRQAKEQAAYDLLQEI